MASKTQKISFWLVLTLISTVLLYSVWAVFLPFLIAGVISYLLHPVVHKLVRFSHFSHQLVAFLVYLIFITCVSLILIIVIPLVYEQIVYFMQRMPEYRQFTQDHMLPSIINYVGDIDPNIATKIEGGLYSFANSLFLEFGDTMQGVWDYTIATINILIIILLLPIILFYFLRDWNKMRNVYRDLFPKHTRYGLTKMLMDIDAVLAAYIRGQLNICFLMAFVYSIGLQLIGIDFAIILGIMSGFFIVLPLIGVITPLSINLLVAYFEYGIGNEMLMVLLLFVIGHFIEGYILAPRVIGKKIGLHPLWITFAVLAGANLFGLTGMIVAIPIAGITKVIIVHFMTHYKNSEFYTQR